MTNQETINILTYLTSAYPRYFVLNEASAELWSEYLADLPFDLVQMAVKKHILQQKFPPTIAEIREHAVKILDSDTALTGPRAWDLTVRAIRDFGYTRRKEGIASLPPIVQEVVETIGWSALCSSTQLDVIRGQFFKAFDRIQQDRRAQEMLPPAFHQQLQAVVHHALSEGGHDV